MQNTTSYIETLTIVIEKLQRVIDTNPKPMLTSTDDEFRLRRAVRNAQSALEAAHDEMEPLMERICIDPVYAFTSYPLTKTAAAEALLRGQFVKDPTLANLDIDLTYWRKQVLNDYMNGRSSCPLSNAAAAAKREALCGLYRDLGNDETI